jgi:cell division septum initiation protein DivIVA
MVVDAYEAKLSVLLRENEDLRSQLKEFRKQLNHVVQQYQILDTVLYFQ